MTEMTKEEQIDLDNEFARISESFELYLEKVKPWKKVHRTTSYLALVSLVLIIVPLYMPNPKEGLPLYVFSFGLGLLIVDALISSVANNKILKIDAELGLSKDEYLYLYAHEASFNIETCLDETNPKRKQYMRESSVNYMRKMIEAVGDWTYGNMGLTKKLLKEPVDLLKDNLRRLVLPNVAEGNEKELLKASEVLCEFCLFLNSPSIEKLNQLNTTINELPYKEYKVLSRKDKLKDYLNRRPRLCRLAFAFSTTTAIVITLLYFDQNVGVVIAVGVTCFWGSLSGFDKVFRPKEK